MHDFVCGRALDLQSEHIEPFKRFFQCIEALMFVPEILRDDCAHAYRAWLETDEFRFRFRHVQQHDAAAKCLGEFTHGGDESFGHVGKIHRHEDCFHKALRKISTTHESSSSVL